MRLILVAMVILGYGIGYSDAQIRKPRTQPAPVVVAAQPAPVQGGAVREKLVLAVVKARVIAKLQSDGVNGKKLSRAEAVELYERLDDEVIRGCVHEAAPDLAKAIGEGGPLARLLEWIRTHPDEVAAIIKLILSLLALL